MKKMINVAMVLVMVAMCATFFALGYIYPTKTDKAYNEPKIIVTEETTEETALSDEEIVVDYFGEEGFKLLQHRIDDGHFALVTIYNVDGSMNGVTGYGTMRALARGIENLPEGQHMTVFNGEEVRN